MVGIFLGDRPTTATRIRIGGYDWTSARPWWCAHALHTSRTMCGARFFPPSANTVAAACRLCVRRRRARGETHTRPPPPPPSARTHTHQCLCDCHNRRTPLLTVFESYSSYRYLFVWLLCLSRHIF